MKKTALDQLMQTQFSGILQRVHNIHDPLAQILSPTDTYIALNKNYKPTHGQAPTETVLVPRSSG